MLSKSEAPTRERERESKIACKNLQSRCFFAIIIVLAYFVFFQSVTPVLAATLLSDDFTGTTIDTAKWNETDAGGVGGTTGNIQQNGSLTTTGSGTWGSNYVVTDTTYDRSLGGLEMEVDITCVSGSIVGVGYGDPGVLTGGGQSYTLYSYGSAIYFSRQNANSNAENISSGFSCTTGVTFNARITIGTTTGAALYINGSGTPAVTLTGGTFNNKGFFLSGHSGSATTIDNFVVSGAGAATEPDAPTDLVATPASTQMVLTWTAPVDNGGASITDYIVEYKLNSEPTTWTTFADGTSASTGATVTGLTNDLSYNFRVSAVNSVGTGAVSSTATAIPALSTPTAPQSLSATNSESGQSTLTWSAPLSDGGASITDYVVEYKLNSEPTTWTTFSDGTSATTGAVVTGLTNGSLYNFRVSAVNSVGTGTVSSTVNATPASVTFSDDFTGTIIDTDKWDEDDADGLGGTVGSVVQDGTLDISPNNGSWSAQDGVATIDTFDRTDGDISMTVSVSRSSCGSGVGPVAFGYGDINFTTVGSASYILLSNNTTWEIYYWSGGGNQGGSPRTITGLTSCTNGVPITFELVALQAGGAEVYVNGSDTASATLAGGTFTNKSFWIGGYQSGGVVSYDDVSIIEPAPGPFAPTGLSGVAGDEEVSLSWTSGGDNGDPITDYVVEYKLSTSGSWSTFADGTSATTSATVTGLANGSLYNFRVSAVNGNGTSDVSSTANATPVSSAPTAPTATSVSISGSASLGEIIAGTYTYNDVNGNAEATSTYRWLRADSAGGTYSAISGATSINYTVTSDDLTKYLKFEVTPVSNTSPTTGIPVLSSATSQVTEIDYINQILSTGQSLSVGVASTPALTTTQPYSNLMLSGGNGGIGSGGSFIPLVEASVETISSSMANTITANDTGNDFDVAVSLHGVSGYTYSQLKKGTSPYNTGMTQVTNAKSAAITLGRTSRVIGVTTIHGETDNYNGVSGATYQGYLEEWQNDYDTDVKAITGQSNEVIMFLDQMSSFMSSYANDATSEIPIYQLYAAEENPNEIVLVAPKYFFNYSDRHHLTGASSRWLGEYYGKVIKKVVIDHETWRPLSPDSAIRSGNIIDVNFHVPAGILAFDTTLVSARTNYGFEYYDSTASATISSVEILDDDTVRITLSGIPTGSNQRIRYAYTGIPGTSTGAQNAGSAAGNLRDTDPYTSLYGNTLYNWAVHFDEAVVLDSIAPTISSVSSTPSTTTVDIIWTTNESGSTIIDYGLTNSYSNTTVEADTLTRVTSHSATLSSLVACTTYHYRVKSKDATLNLATGSDNTFTTAGCTGSATVEDETASSITTASGGSISQLSDSKGVTLTIPASFSGSDANFQIKQLDKTATINTTSTPTGYSTIGSYIYDLKALSDISTAISTFDNSITVTIAYGTSDVSGINEASLKIYRWDGSNWNQLSGCSVNTPAKTVSCTTTAFSVFGLFGQSGSSSSSSGSSSSASAASCGDQAPGSKVPWLYGAIPQGTGSIILYFTEADSPVTKYVLEYGTKSGEYQFGVQDLGVNERNQMTFEVKSLSPNTTYYFRVRAQNGCAPGNWSNELSAKTKGIVSLNQLEFTESSLKPVKEESKPSACQTYTVKSGDALWKIAASELGDGNRYKEIIWQNKEMYSSLETSNNVRVGWKLKINCDGEEKETKKSSQDETPAGYAVKVKVVNTKKEPVVGATVTLHSDPKTVKTNKDGIAKFENIEPGDHKVLIAYANYEGEQSINLTGDIKEFALNVTIEQKPLSLSPLAYGIIGILIVIIILLVIRFRRKSSATIR